MTGDTPARRPADETAVERGAGAVALAAMLLTPFGRRGGRLRRVLTTVTVLAGATRTVAADARGHGLRRAAAVNVTTGVVTWAAEVVGVATGRLFGRYRYTAALRPQVGGVPVLVPLAWVAMAAPAHATAAAIAPQRATRVAGGAAALAAWDLFLDPQMIAEGYWRWDDRGRYRGVPLANFRGWLAVGAAAMLIRELAARSGPDAADDADADRADASHVATYAVVAVMETVAFATFLRDKRVAAAGGAAMLPLAGAALVRLGRP